MSPPWGPGRPPPLPAGPSSWHRPKTCSPPRSRLSAASPLLIAFAGLLLRRYCGFPLASPRRGGLSQPPRCRLQWDGRANLRISSVPSAPRNLRSLRGQVRPRGAAGRCRSHDPAMQVQERQADDMGFGSSRRRTVEAGRLDRQAWIDLGPPSPGHQVPGHDRLCYPASDTVVSGSAWAGRSGPFWITCQNGACGISHSTRPAYGESMPRGKRSFGHPSTSTAV